MHVNEFKPVAFHSYTSSVRERIFEASYGSKTEAGRDIELMRRELIALFNAKGIKTIYGGDVQNDNKIVFEVEVKGIKLFYGFYDWMFSIGLSCYDENEEHEKRRREYEATRATKV